MTPEEIAALREKARAAKKPVAEMAPIEAAPIEADEEDEFAPPVPAVADPELDDPEPVAEPVPEGMTDEMRVLLAGLDPEVAASFSVEELRDIIESEREKARAAKMASARKTLQARAATQARIAAGLADPQTLRDEAEIARLNEKITFRIRLPQQGSGHKGALPAITLDQEAFQHGKLYTRSRAVFETVNEIQNRAWQHEFVFRGLPIEHYRMMLEAVNAQQLSAGMSAGLPN